MKVELGSKIFESALGGGNNFVINLSNFLKNMKKLFFVIC